MSTPPPLPRTPGGSRRFFDAYTQGMTTADVNTLKMAFLMRTEEIKNGGRRAPAAAEEPAFVEF